jgi:hypothetical protein
VTEGAAVTLRSRSLLQLSRCLLIVAVVGCWRPALAQDALATCDCQRDCQDRRDPAASLDFDNEEHRLWYELRFWQGACDDRLSWCFSGDDWYDLMSEVLERLSAAAQVEFCPRLWSLGQLIGHEWARDNAVRRIDTDDLEDWQEAILESDELPATLTRIEGAVADRLR